MTSTLSKDVKIFTIIPSIPPDYHKIRLFTDKIDCRDKAHLLICQIFDILEEENLDLEAF